MCGRFALSLTIEKLLEFFPYSRLDRWQPSWNICPGGLIPFAKTPKCLTLGKWGFSSSKGFIINARSESLLEKPTFAPLWPQARSVIPASAFYEWQGKQPYAVKPSKPLFYFASLYRGDELVILTQDAKKKLTKVHHRKPVLLSQEGMIEWLCQKEVEPIDEESLSLYPVSKALGKTTYNTPECLQEHAIEPDLFSLHLG